MANKKEASRSGRAKGRPSGPMHALHFFLQRWQEAIERFKEKVNEGICSLKRNHSGCRVALKWRNVGKERSQGKRGWWT